MADTDDRLGELRERWAADPSSRVFLQLAEEYRRLGRVAEAVEVLEKGLDYAPNHLSAQVALGRCRLELKEYQEAIRILERVIEKDPTQLVANKLLVEAYLNRHEFSRAAERLDHYALLNDGDPAIEVLRSRLEEGKRSREPLGSEESPFLLPVEGGAGHPNPEDPLDLLGVGGAPAPPKPNSAPDASEPRVSAPKEDPFPELGAPKDLEKYLGNSEKEEVFSLPRAKGAADSASIPVVSSAAEAVPIFPGTQSADPAAVGEGDVFGVGGAPTVPARESEESLFDLPSKSPAAPSPLAQEAAAEQAAPQQEAAEPFATPSALADSVKDRGDEAADAAPVFELPPAEVAEAVPPGPLAGLEAPLDSAELRTEAAEPSTSPETSGAAGIPEEEAPVSNLVGDEGPSAEKAPAAAPEGISNEAATLTLGRLYQSQGHQAEADRIFRAVLAREPNNTEARLALGLPAESPSFWTLTASDLLAGRDSEASAGLSERKATLLKNYLQRVRREA